MVYVDEYYGEKESAKAAVEWYKKHYTAFINMAYDEEKNLWHVWGKYFGWD
jgi:hypothetical protein